MRRRLPSMALAAMLAFACGCAPNAPRLLHPLRWNAFCGKLEPRFTGLDSILTSTNDRLLDVTPTDAQVAREAQSGDGLLAYWDAQPLLLPDVAKALGESDGYVHVDEAAVPPAGDTATTRRLYLKLRVNGSDRWVALTAFDVQDICVEGHRDV